MGTFAPALGLSHAWQVRLFWIGAALFVVAIVVWVVSWWRSRHVQAGGDKRMAAGDDRSIRTDRQSGGVNITGDINMAPQPGVSVERLESHAQGDVFVTTFRVTLDRARYAINELRVVAFGTKVQEVDIGPEGGGGTQNVRVDEDPKGAWAWQSISSPQHERYIATVLAGDPAIPEITAKLS